VEVVEPRGLRASRPRAKRNMQFKRSRWKDRPESPGWTGDFEYSNRRRFNAWEQSIVRSRAAPEAMRRTKRWQEPSANTDRHGGLISLVDFKFLLDQAGFPLRQGYNRSWSL